MPGIEEIVNYQDIWDYGARGDGNTNDAKAINAAIAAAVSRNANGGRVLIRPTASFYNLETPILLQDDVEILLVGGALLKVGYGVDADAIFGSGVSRCRIHGNGVIMGTYDFTKTFAGIRLLNSYLCSIEGVHIAGMGRSGIYINGGSDHRIRNVVCASNGGNGIRLSGTTRCHVDSPICYNNGQFAAGSDGIALDTAATHNTIVNPACFDAVGPYPVNQAYPIREVAASGCDFTYIVGLQAVGNATSQNPSLIGANSKWTDSAATVALVGTPAPIAHTAVLGTSLNAASLDHVHSATANVGATPAPHLNTVLLASPVLTTISGSGDVALTAATLTSLPAEAVSAFIRVVFTNTTVGCEFRIAAGDNANILMDAQVSVTTLSPMSNARIRVAPGATNQIQYAVVGTSGGGGAAWTALVTLQGYEVPA